MSFTFDIPLNLIKWSIAGRLQISPSSTPVPGLHSPGKLWAWLCHFNWAIGECVRLMRRLPFRWCPFPGHVCTRLIGYNSCKIIHAHESKQIKGGASERVKEVNTRGGQLAWQLRQTARSCWFGCLLALGWLLALGMCLLAFLGQRQSTANSSTVTTWHSLLLWARYTGKYCYPLSISIFHKDL